MSILIKDMKMPSEPTNITFYQNGWWKDYVDGPSGKWVGIPPHGRLIDADAFLNTIRPICDEDAYKGCTFETVKRLIIEHISDAPTIIEAES